ncbi:MAG: hypothetical protein O2999_06420 [Nitrospirae bacterium]|nr:hypothetical protein [Nitrospirota bacterium]MDA1303918.1 hypothetical protein [Nitrospirota bacterium]
MRKKPLIETNPFFKTPEKYRKALVTNIATSTAIETGMPVEEIARMLSEKEKAKPVKKSKGSAQ